MTTFKQKEELIDGAKEGEVGLGSVGWVVMGKGEEVGKAALDFTLQ